MDKVLGSVIRHSTENVSTAPESSGGCFTPLHLMLSIVFDDVRLAYSCSATETHSMKLPLHVFCVDINGRGCLEIFSYCMESANALWLRFAPVLKHFHLPIVPLTVDHGISSRNEIP